MQVQDIGPRDVGGEQIRGELNSRVGATERRREGLDQRRLRDAGDALQEDVTSRERRDQEQINRLRATDLDLGDLSAKRISEPRRAGQDL